MHRTSSSTSLHKFGLHVHISLGHRHIHTLHVNNLASHLEYLNSHQTHSLTATPQMRCTSCNLLRMPKVATFPVVTIQSKSQVHVSVIYCHRNITGVIAVQVLHKDALFRQGPDDFQISTVHLTARPHRFGKISGHAGVTDLLNIATNSICRIKPW